VRALRMPRSRWARKLRKKLSKRLDRCEYKIDARKTLALLCK
jgi:hypothetical protein